MLIPKIVQLTGLEKKEIEESLRKMLKGLPENHVMVDEKSIFGMNDFGKWLDSEDKIQGMEWRTIINFRIPVE